MDAPPEPVAGKASKCRIYGPESAKAGGWAARPGDKVPQQGQWNPAAAKRAPPAEGSYKP